MSNLPTLSEIYDDKEISKKQDQLNFLLNQKPPKKWLGKNKYAGNAIYISIDRVEWLLRKIFKNYKIEVREVKQIFNGVSCTVRIHFQNPTNGEWSYHDGVGAGQIQTKKGKSPADMQNINNNAIQLVVPIARAEAIKNASKSFGRLFGSDLNRKSKVSYSGLIEFDENHPNWRAAVDTVASGDATIEDVKSKYEMTDEVEKQFNDEIK